MGTGDALAYGTNAPSLQVKNITAQQVAEAIRIGPANMPRFSGNLTDQQVPDIVSYVTGRLQHPDQPGWLRARRRGPGGRGLRRPAHRRRRSRPHLLLDRRALVSDSDHQPSRTRVPMPIAALSDPHMGDAARHPERAERIIAGILVLAIIFMALFGAASRQNWEPVDARRHPRRRPVPARLRAHGLGQVPHAPGSLRRGAAHARGDPRGARRHVRRAGRALGRRRQAAQAPRWPLRRRRRYLRDRRRSSR